jgi:Flp pilus assembly protein TadB
MISLIALAVIAGIFYWYRKQKPDHPQIKQDVPELIDTLLVLIRAGHGPAAAMSQIHNWAPEVLKPNLYRAQILGRASTRSVTFW